MWIECVLVKVFPVFSVCLFAPCLLSFLSMLTLSLSLSLAHIQSSPTWPVLLNVFVSVLSVWSASWSSLRSIRKYFHTQTQIPSSSSKINRHNMIYSCVSFCKHTQCQLLSEQNIPNIWVRRSDEQNYIQTD